MENKTNKMFRISGRVIDPETSRGIVEVRVEAREEGWRRENPMCAEAPMNRAVKDDQVEEIIRILKAE